MKQSNMFLTRCLAVLLALALCLGNVSTGLALTVFAADNSEKTSVNDAASTVPNEQLNAENDGVAGNSITLYNLIAELSGNSAADAILNSGALAGDVQINYTLPTADALTLVDGVLTAPDQEAGEFVWEPLYYGGIDNMTANAFNGANTADWATKTVFVTYGLALTEYNPVFQSAEADLQALKFQFDEQLAAMTDLMEWKADMEELSRMKLRVFNSIISGYDFTEEDGDDTDAKNLELRAYFLNLISTLLNERSGETYLTMVDMLNVYETNGMVYFFQNAKAIGDEVRALSECLKGLVGDEEKENALAELMDLFNYSHYIDLIADLGTAMESIGGRLIYSNEEISTTSAISLKAYVDAMASIASADEIAVEAGELVIVAEPLKAEDDSIVTVVIEVVNNGKVEHIFLPEEYDRDAVVTEEIIETVIEKAAEKAEAIVAETVAVLEETGVVITGDASRFFDVEIDEEALNELVGQPIGAIAAPKLTVQPKEFVIRFLNAMTRNVEQQVITVLDRTIELPQFSEDKLFRNEYYINGTRVGLNGFHTFSIDEMDTLFVDQQYEMERVVIDRREEMINTLMTVLNEESGDVRAVRNGNTIEIFLPNANSVSDIAVAIVEQNTFGYLALNEQPFFYNEGDFQRVSMQAVLNAVLADEEFSNETIIALAQNDGGKLMTASAQLGGSTEDIVVTDLTLVFNLESAPSKLVTLGNGLNAIKNQFTFNTDVITDVDGNKQYALALNLDLPEKIYEAYLAVLLASYEIDQSNINDINNEIAVEFFYDYIDAVMGSENLSIQTFQNTLDIMINTVNHLPKIEIADKDVLHLAKYFDLVNDVYKNMTYYPMGEEPGQLLTATTDTGLKEILSLLGIEIPAALNGIVVEMIPGNESFFWTTANLANASKDFEALVLDLDAGVAGMKDLYKAYQNGELKEEALEMAKGYGLANAIDFTTNLSERAAELTGQAIIVLMGDTQGDLVINEATVLDLNGHVINGDVIANNGHLLIVDSTMSNNQAGGVNGNVSGHVMIISGNYTDDVTAFLKDGYAQDENGMVKNELFRVEKNGDDLTYYLNSDVMHEQAVAGLLPNMGVVAAEIAIDVALNQYPLTYLAAAGVEVMNISVENIIGLIVSNDKLSDCAQELLDLVNVRGIAHLAKELAKELVDFEGIAAAIMNDEKIGDVTLNVAPWDVTVDHIYGNGADYLTIGYEFNADEMKTVNLGFAFEGENVKQFVQLLVELKHIFNPERSYLDVDIFRPTFENKVASFGGIVEGRLSFDLTVPYNTDGEANCYPAVIAVALAYANEDNRAELVAALNADNDYNRNVALKQAIDKCSVEDVVSALKLMNRTTSFYEMAEAVGANVSIEEAELEIVWHFVTVCFGKLLQIGDEIGRESLLGALDADNDGVYVLESTYSADADAYAKGYGLYVNAEKLYECFEVKVFDFDCLWGDVNHDGFVNAKDATLVLQYSVGTNEGFFCELKADVNGDGFINAKDATLILQHSVGTITKFPVEG